MNAGFLFPGQGAQREGMLHDLVDHPAVRETIQEISEALGFDVRSLDTADALRSTVSVQLALLTAGVATARALICNGIQPVTVAGLSIGSFAAAVIADSIALADAARLVHTRATAMETMFPSGYGLAVIVGLNETQVTQLVSVHHTDAHPVFVGNINAARQVGLAGSIEGMQLVLADAVNHGARKAELLHVAVPSHCPLLQPVAETLHQQIQSIEIRAPKVPYIANVTARAIRTAHGIAQDLADNIAHSVRWDDATRVCQELGCDTFLEMPPGHTLTDLARESLPEVQSRPVTRAAFTRIEF